MEAAPFHADLAEGPKGGSAQWCQTDDGWRVRVGFWPLAGAQGTVLIFPGRTEYIEKYGRSAVDYQARGFAVAAIDWRGQGLADRLTPDHALGYVERFTDYQHDVAQMLAAVKAAGLPEPYYLVAHSMGGAIGLRALMRGLPVRAAAFSAPMWGISVSPMLRPIAWGLSELARVTGNGLRYPPGTQPETYVLAADFEDNTLTRDRDQFDYMRRQLQAQPELALGGPSYHWLNEALHDMLKLRALPLPDLPVEVHLGSNERIVMPNAMRSVVARWKTARLIVHAKAEHEIMMERESVRTAFFESTSALFKAAAPGSKA